jgi:hypothetical protein
MRVRRRGVRIPYWICKDLWWSVQLWQRTHFDNSRNLCQRLGIRGESLSQKW